VYSEKLKLIEEELSNLKNKYQKLETDAKRTEKCSPEKLSKFQKEITNLKEECSRLAMEKNKLTKELEEVRTSYENTKTAFSKTDKELLQLRRSQQELLAEKSSRDKELKKYQEEKKYFLNRIQELSIIGKLVFRSKTIEVRLCVNIFACCRTRFDARSYPIM
jgi:chromosome segregation ATPase